MIKQKIADLEEYGDTSFLIKKLYKGERSEAVLINLRPGQEVPPHSHDRFEVVLLPQKGQGLLTVQGEEPVRLDPGTVYYQPAGCRFGVANSSEGSFQMAIIDLANPAARTSLFAPA